MITLHEKILQGVTIGVVAGLFVYWLTSSHHADCAGKNSSPGDYKPILGDVRTVRFGSPSCFCDCAPLTSGTKNSPVLLATDYLCGSPQYAEPTSGWNLGVSLQLSCEGIDLHSCINRRETGTSFPYGARGPNTLARPIRIPQQISCNPDVCVPVECTEVI